VAVDRGNYKEGHGDGKVVTSPAGTHTHTHTHTHTCHLSEVAGGLRVLRNVSWSPTWTLVFLVQEGLGPDKKQVAMISLSWCSCLHAQKALFTLSLYYAVSVGRETVHVMFPQLCSLALLCVSE
jgi:hypothetical protein